jgi:iron(III) transport system substrate-binding protein
MMKFLPGLCCVLLAAVVLAQSQAPRNALFQYRGTDRDANLVERAKEEGRVVLYTSLAPAATEPIAAAFEQKYGIQVALWRARSEQVVQRTVTEARASRHVVDVIEIGGPEMEVLAREQLLASFHSPHVADLPVGAIPTHRTWYADLLTFYLVAYNTTQVQRSEIPATLAGFADPRWQGRIALEATDARWMATLVKAGRVGTGMEFFRTLSALGPDVRQGHASRPLISYRFSPSSRLTKASASRRAPRIRTPRCSLPTTSSRRRDRRCSHRSGTCRRARA